MLLLRVAAGILNSVPNTVASTRVPSHLPVLRNGIPLVMRFSQSVSLALRTYGCSLRAMPLYAESDAVLGTMLYGIDGR